MRKPHILHPKLPAQLCQSDKFGFETHGLPFPSSKPLKKLPHPSLCLQKGWVSITGMFSAWPGPTCGWGRALHAWHPCSQPSAYPAHPSCSRSSRHKPAPLQKEDFKHHLFYWRTEVVLPSKTINWDKGKNGLILEPADGCASEKFVVMLTRGLSINFSANGKDAPSPARIAHGHENFIMKRKNPSQKQTEEPHRAPFNH